MPGFYQPGEYDMAGFCVGIVEKSRMLNGSQVQIGDIAIGLASSGVHSNGFSLVRKVISDMGWDWNQSPETLGGQSIAEVCLTPTQIYVKPVLQALRNGLEIHGMAHITGGGLPENLPRCLSSGQSIKIHPDSWPILPIFHWLAQEGEISSVAMFDTFNMGIGFVVLVPPQQAESTKEWFKTQGIAAYSIGEVVSGTGDLIGLPTN
jgi:phosphoribosylformylglycinamidine cyclo-ligase